MEEALASLHLYAVEVMTHLLRIIVITFDGTDTFGIAGGFLHSGTGAFYCQA